MLTFAEKLNIMLEKKNWSKAELARISKITPQQISYYTNGDREPSKENIKKLAKAFDVETAIFMDDLDSKETLLGMWELAYDSYQNAESPEIKISENETPEYSAIQRKSKQLSQKDQRKLLKIMEATFDEIDDGKFIEDEEDDL